MSVKRSPPAGGACQHKNVEMPIATIISTPTRHANASNVSIISKINVSINPTSTSANSAYANSSGSIFSVAMTPEANCTLQTPAKKRGRDSPPKPKKVSKQQKLHDYWLRKPSEYRNQFEVLGSDGEENETQSTTQEPPRETKPPPIYVSGVENIQPQKNLLKENEMKIQPKTIEIYQIISKALVDKNTEFHTFRPKQDKTYNVVLKGIHSSTPIEEIKEEIENMGHEVSNISNIKNRISKRPLPMFYINLKPKSNNKDIYKCSAILHTKISFEPPRKKCEMYPMPTLWSH